MPLAQLPQRLGGDERAPSTGDRAGGSSGAARVGTVGRLLLTGEPGEVAQRFQIGYARQQHPRPVAVDHGFGLLAVAAARLSQVVEDRHQLDVVAGRGGGNLSEVRQRGDIARLIQADQQRQLETAAIQSRPFVRSVDHLREQCQEERAQELRGLGVAHQVKRPGLLEEPVGGDLAGAR